MTAAGGARLAEALETVAFRDIVAAAPPALGARVADVAGATLLIGRGLPPSVFNRVIGLGVAQPASEADVDAVVDAYRRAGASPFWIHVTADAQPPELTPWLARRGFAPPARKRWAHFLRPTTDPPTVDTPCAIRLARPSDAATVGHVASSAFGMPAALGGWFGSLADRPGWRVFLAEADGRAIATGSLYVTPRGGWLGIGATLKEFRKRGAQSALLAARIAAAAAAGCAVVSTETGEPMADEPNPSFDNIRRSGFVQVGSRLNLASPA